MRSAPRALLIVFTLFVAFDATAQETAQPDAPAAASAPGAAEAKVLVDLLKDDTARAALIARLEEASRGVSTDTASAESAGPGLTTAIAQRTKQGAEKLASLVGAATEALGDVQRVFSGDPGDVLGGSLAIARDLAVLVLLTLALFLLLRAIANRIYVRLARRASEAGWLRTLSLLVVSSMVDAVTAVGACAAGYGAALALGESGSLAVSQTLFLNAFLLIELVKVGVRAVLSPRYPDLRMLPLGDEGAAYWNFWTSRLISLLGYGLLLAAPVVKQQVSVASGEALGVLVALTALIMVMLIVLQNRAAVRALLKERAERATGRIEAGLLLLLGRSWHLLAMLYATGLFVAWVTNPDEAAGWMVRASLQSLVAIGLGALVNGFIARWVQAGIMLPDDVRQRLPLLEQRLNAYVPAILRVVRLAIGACVVLAFAQVWGMVDILAWLQREAGREALLRVASAFLLGVAALAVYLAVSSWVEYRLNPNFGSVPTARERTLLALFRNAFTIALVVITTMLVLAQLGVNIGPLLAGAGVLGLAIGFGSQKLVQDVITGAFIQLENVMNEGDVVTVGGITGKVERLTIRSVGVRDLNGVYHVIPFSSADSVSNFMSGFSYHVAELGVAYRENVGEVKQVMQEAFDRLKETEHGENLIEDLEMHGLTQFADSAVLVRARLKCKPGTQWALGRAYNEIIKELFDERGIEIPFPHVTLYIGEDKNGESPPLNVRGQLDAPPQPAPAS